MEAVEFEAARVDTLDKLFSALEKQESFAEQAQRLQKFAEDTKAEFDKKVCAGLKSELQARNAEVAALKNEIAALAAGSTDLAAKQKLLKAAEETAKALENRRKTKDCKD